jgi:hypothetical protein
MLIINTVTYYYYYYYNYMKLNNNKTPVTYNFLYEKIL